MFLVCIADCCCCRVGVEIVFFLSEGYSALRNVDDVLLGVLLVCTDIYTEEFIVAIWNERELNVEEFFYALCFFQSSEYSGKRFYSVCISTLLIHGELIQVTKFLFYRTFSVCFLE